MEPKKISFGFNKIQKKTTNALLVPKEEKKIELVKCLEGQSIKLLNEKIPEPEKILVIPLIESTKTASAIASLKARQEVLNGEPASETSEKNSALPAVEHKIPDNETLENKAARELLEAINNKNEDDEVESTLAVVPKADQLPLDGAQEATLDDYESIPIKQFGFAMLRGMGWKEEPKSKNDKKDITEQNVRPKGMGLGADKVAKHKPALVPPEPNEVLEIKKKAFVRILGGKNKDLYGQIEGFDDHAGRVIIKLALGGGFESLNEFLVQPVCKKEYAQYGKVINSAKYEEYKKLENAHGQIILKPSKNEKTEENDYEDNKKIVKQEKHIEARSSRKYSSDSDDESRNRRRTTATKQEERDHERKQRDEYRRRRSKSRSNSKSSTEFRSHKKSSKSKKNKSRDRSRHKCSSSEDEKRHKKKTKKSKRPRSRSRGRRR